MKKSMIKVINTTTNAIVYLVTPIHNIKAMCDLLDESNAKYTPNKYAVIESGNMNLADLPEEVQIKVKETLKMYDQTHVYFEYNEFSESPHSCLKAHYNHDHFFCGTYYAKDVYTAEERKVHLAELNSYDFPEWAW